MRVQPSWIYSNEPGWEGGDGEEGEAEHLESPKTKPSTWPTATEPAATSSGLDMIQLYHAGDISTFGYVAEIVC